MNKSHSVRHQAANLIQKQAQLYALPDEQQRKKPVIFTPKVLILSMLATIVISRNLYNYYMLPKPDTKPVQIDTWQNVKLTWERVWGYAVLTIIMFTLFIILRRKNDKYQEQRMKRQQQQEQQKGNGTQIAEHNIKQDPKSQQSKPKGDLVKED